MFVNPKNLQKRLFISSNPTFVYLQNNASAHFLCPKCPAPHIPIIWHRPVKGQFNPIFTGPEYTIEFPNYYHSGLIKCSFISSNRKYEHTFILSFQNRLAHTLRPTAKMYTTKSIHPAPTLLPVQTNTIFQTTLRSTTEISTPHKTVASTVPQPVIISQQTST